jgi:hypothetical protein
MARYRRRVITYEPVDLEKNELVTKYEACKILHTNLDEINRAIGRGALTEIIDLDHPDASGHLFRGEVLNATLMKWPGEVVKEKRPRTRKTVR